MMHATLKDILRACRVDLKKNLTKREKWIKEWPGQMLITASQMQWTSDSEKALSKGDKKGLKSLKKKQVRLDFEKKQKVTTHLSIFRTQC